jgi:hypothetical protein
MGGTDSGAEQPAPPPRRSIEEIKAEARAYALSVSGVKKKKQAAVTKAVVQEPPQCVTQWPAAYAPYVAPAVAAWTASSTSLVPTQSSTTTLPMSSSVAADSQNRLEAKSTAPSIGPLRTEQPTVATSVQPQQFAMPDLKELDDYERFVRLLVLDLNVEEDNLKMLMDDDEEEFQLDSVEEEDEDDDDDEDEEFDETDNLETNDEATNVDGPVASTPNQKPLSDEGYTPLPLSLDLGESSFPSLEASDFYREIDEELCWLEEEDMEAAVATLLNYPPATSNSYERLGASPQGATNSKQFSHAHHSSSDVIRQEQTAGETPTDNGEHDEIDGLSESETTNLERKHSASAGMPPPFSESNHMRGAALRSHHRTAVTPEQHQQLKELLQKHYQLLLQQAVLAVRAAHRGRRYQTYSIDTDKQLELFTGVDSADALAEALDGAVGMLQDLDENRKDAIRHQMQFENSKSSSGNLSPKRSLFAQLAGDQESFSGRYRRLTRAQFSKSLDQNGAHVQTVFDVRGLSKLKTTFDVLDGIVEGSKEGENILNVLSVRW